VIVNETAAVVYAAIGKVESSNKLLTVANLSGKEGTVVVLHNVSGYFFFKLVPPPACTTTPN
jgi:hypothetical protein